MSLRVMIAKKEACMIYYLADLSAYRVKVGYTTPDLIKKRFSNIQVGNSNPLRLVGVHSGDRDKESFIKEKLKQANVRGEWYSIDNTTLSHIESHNDFEYFFDVFRDILKNGGLQEPVFKRFYQQYLRKKALISIWVPSSVDQWIDNEIEEGGSQKWQSVIPTHLFDEIPQYRWERAERV